MNRIRRIRIEVFSCTQVELAAIAQVTQPTVSRWEKDEFGPDLIHIARLRAEAKDRGLDWDDALLFEEAA